MRQIKFRAWNGREFVNDYYNHKHFISISDGKIIQVQHDDVCNEGVVYGKPEEIVLLQFTGFADINGVDIYEGDILKSPAGFLWLVGFNHRGCFVAHEKSDIEDFVFIDDFEFTIIGNIYETPELLSKG